LPVCRGVSHTPHDLNNKFKEKKRFIKMKILLLDDDQFFSTIRIRRGFLKEENIVFACPIKPCFTGVISHLMWNP